MGPRGKTLRLGGHRRPHRSIYIGKLIYIYIAIGGEIAQRELGRGNMQRQDWGEGAGLIHKSWFIAMVKLDASKPRRVPLVAARMGRPLCP